MRNKLIGFGLIALVLGLLAWARWEGVFSTPARRVGGVNSIQHFAQYWSRALQAYVVGGRVDYRGWKESQAELSKIMGELESLGPEEVGSGVQALGFWIDYYNARVVHEVLAGQSPQTAVGRTKLFALTRFFAAGKRMSLTDVENSIRSSFAEPRIHFAINCASFSCPALRSASYQDLSGQEMDRILSQQAREFLADETKNRFDLKTGKAYLSQIFEWYQKDFLKDGQSLQVYLSEYAPDAAKDQLRSSGFELEYLPYNWSPNGTL